MNNITELESKAEKIITDLLELDQSLKPLEIELRKLVAEFIKNKPEPLLSERFETELKSVLVEKIKELKNENMQEKNIFSQGVLFKKLAFSLGAMVLALLILIPTVNSLKNKNLANNEDLILVEDNATKITRLDDKAFGEINFQNNVEGAEENFVKPMVNDLNSGAQAPKPEITNDKLVIRNDSYKGETYLIDASTTTNSDGLITMIEPAATKEIIGMGGFDGNIDIAPDFIEYPSFAYIYEGDDLTELVAGLDKVDVYKRVKSQYNNPSLLNFITNMGSDLINLKKFNDNASKVSYFSINEEKEFGYVLSFDSNGGGISLYQNWQYWPQFGNECRDEACFARYRFNYTDLISNEEAVSIAENFLNNFGIDRNTYGEAAVNYDFHQIYEASENKSELYVPEETTVIFPILIEGKEVKDESGQAYGLYVNVNSRHKKVSGLNNLLPNRYEVSAYESFNDPEEIKRLAEQGGLNFYKDPYATKEIKVYLGTPTLILSRQFQYGEGYDNSELFVPALSFPVLRLSEETQFFYQKNIVIPLVKDLINQNNQGDEIEIMPYPAVDMAR